MDNNDFQNLLDTYWAKSPDTNGVAETISEHTECVLKEADLLVQLGYISDDLSNLLHYACEKHDYGKVNEHMQTRLHNKSIHFDPDSEVQHNLLSALFIDDHDFGNSEDFISVLYAVLYHHDNHYDNSSFAYILSHSNQLIDAFHEKYKDVLPNSINRKALTIINLFNCRKIIQCNPYLSIK